MNTLETLRIYTLAKEFRKEVMLVYKTFPNDEKYLLTAQIKDSSRSVTANIAEGYGRYYYKEAMKFYRVARGSLLETEDHLSTALDETYISQAKFDELQLKRRFLLEKMNGYIAFLKREQNKE